MNRYFGVHVLDGEWHALLPRYLVLADRVQDKRVLDIGCGTGIGSSLLLELGASQVDGVDYRPDVLDLAEIKHAKESLDFHTMLWEDLEFDADTFDVVVCLDPNAPVTDPNMLEEVTRVLQSDGEYVCAIERRKIDGVESLLPKYGYSSPAESVEVTGDRDEQAPQIGELTNYFEEFHRVLQRPTYSYTFEVERAEASRDPDAPEPDAVDDTLCTEDSHIAGVEMIYCGQEAIDEPPNRTVRLPYYRLVERLNTVIRDLNLRQAPDREEPFAGPVEQQQRETVPNEQLADIEWKHETGRESEDRDDHRRGESDEPLEAEVAQLTDAYSELRRNFERLRNETQSAMVQQERSIDRLVQVLRRWYDELADDETPPKDPVAEEFEGFASSGLDERAETDVYEPPEPAEPEEDEDDDLADKVEALEHELEARNSYIKELESRVDALAEETSLGEESSEPEGLDEDSSDVEETDDSSSDAGDLGGESSGADQLDDDSDPKSNEG